jgi:hypothetical protein
LLRADLRGSAQRECERLFELILARNLATDVADNPAQAAAQDAQLALMPPELFGMGVAARHHRGPAISNAAKSEKQTPAQSLRT